MSERKKISWLWLVALTAVFAIGCQIYSKLRYKLNPFIPNQLERLRGTSRNLLTLDIVGGPEDESILLPVFLPSHLECADVADDWMAALAASGREVKASCRVIELSKKGALQDTP